MTDDPDTLRLYAEIFAKPRREDPRTRLLDPASPLCLAAAVALRERADRIERERRGPDAPAIDVGQ